ncbi:PP2C-domain-containing protein [Punctularia strigosozonata HHB-11173 SS5]|uniref:PP2C-domain-containing protein n=1 Tax=Punctularia strigosozonata (strain HHB-11173) TaxID=741275 RepID=UPI0004417897|nr:PP2C-domain-containing protein [Punctularia strigosozonata HHB-11173 SS5]EIN12062.1 PP2C-domain-containing protein [Punctularia strigosozonata HHB-11173 SS5]
MFASKFAVVLAMTAAAVATPLNTRQGQCNTGNLHCCNQVQKASQPSTAGLLSLLDIVVQGLDVPVGVGCTPINVIGAGSGATCQQQPVCCDNNHFGGLVAVGCSPSRIWALTRSERSQSEPPPTSRNPPQAMNHSATNDGDAHTKATTTAAGADTHGNLNQKPAGQNGFFTVGVTDEKGKRRTMEDAHSFVFDFAGVRGQGFFAVFDGHAGKDAAEWCGFHFHEYFLQALDRMRNSSIPDTLNQTFHDVDAHLSRRSEESDGKLHSGCTAVTAFLRLEDSSGKQSFLGPNPDLTKVHDPPSDAQLRRVLYCANAGDARGVLCRAGKAVRLTYDHKGSDKQEAKRITDAGGFMMSGRVNGVLAVTRSLGDSAMKEFVVGAPYTTETELSDDDEFLILACDGLWDITGDQGAVNKARAIANPEEASRALVDWALSKGTQDNVTVLVIRFKDSPIDANSLASTQSV